MTPAVKEPTMEVEEEEVGEEEVAAEDEAAAPADPLETNKECPGVNYGAPRRGTKMVGAHPPAPPPHAPSRPAANTTPPSGAIHRRRRRCPSRAPPPRRRRLPTPSASSRSPSAPPSKLTGLTHSSQQRKFGVGPRPQGGKTGRGRIQTKGQPGVGVRKTGRHQKKMVSF